MNKRQTHHQPHIDGLNYSLLEQKGEQDLYRLTGRDTTTGQLINILGSAQEIEDKTGYKISSPEIVDNSLEGRVNRCADTLESVFLRLKEKDPFNENINVYGDDEGWNAITSLVDGQGIDAQKLFDINLKEALEKKGLKFGRPSYSYFTEKSKAGGVWFSISFLNDDIIKQGEIERRTKVCADTLESVFLRLKEKDPFNENINVYGDDEGWNAITSLVDGQGIDAQKLFDINLKEALEKKGLKFGRPSYSYFTEKSKAGGVWFSISFLNDDIIKQGEIERRTKVCADTLESVFLRLKEKDPFNEDINVYADDEGWNAITSLVDGAGGFVKELFDVYLKNELTKKGLGFSTPSYDYFIEKSKAGTVWFNVKKLPI